MNYQNMWTTSIIESSINELFQQQEEKSNNFNRGQIEQDYSIGSRQFNQFDRDNINPFQSIFDNTVDFNNSQLFFKLQKDNSRETAGFRPLVVQQQQLEPNSSQYFGQNLKLLSKRVYNTLIDKKKLTYNDIMQVLLNQSNKQNDKQKHKNLRRRLYDTINVLYAANIIHKNKFEFQIVSNKNQSFKSNGDTKLQCQNQLRSQLQQKQISLIKKKKQLENSLAKLALVQKLTKRNQISQNQISPSKNRMKFQSEKNHQVLKIHFPFLISQFSVRTSVTIQQSKVIINVKDSQQQKLNLSSDIDTLRYLFLVDKDQIEKIKCKLLKRQQEQNL